MRLCALTGDSGNKNLTRRRRLREEQPPRNKGRIENFILRIIEMIIPKRCSSFLLITGYCLLLSTLDIAGSVPVIVSLLDTTPHYDYIQGAVANFGNQMVSPPAYETLLAIPPGNPELCEYPSALQHVSVTASKASRRTQPARHVALLVQRGNCSFLQKALVALNISRNSSKWIVDLVLIYNNNKTESTMLFTPSSNATEEQNKELQKLGIVFVSTSSGYDILQQIEYAEQAENASAVLQAPGFDRWKFQISVEQQLPDRGNPPNPINNDPGAPPQSSGGDAAPTFYWFRFVLFSVLILSPCLRAGYLWYAGGGRLRLRYNDHGRIVGIQYVAPMPYWYGATFVPAAHQSDVTPCLTEDQVRSLPMITYQPPQPSSRNLVDDDYNGHGEEDRVIPAEIKRTRSDERKDEETGQPTAPAPFLMDAQPEQDIQVAPESQQRIPPQPQYTTSCTTCSICIDDFRQGEQLRFLPLCRHAFHTDCIMPWLTERQGCCPLCKSNVLETQGETADAVETNDHNGQIELTTATTTTRTPVEPSVDTLPPSHPPLTGAPSSMPTLTLPTELTASQPSILPEDLLPEPSPTLQVSSTSQPTSSLPADQQRE